MFNVKKIIQMACLSLLALTVGKTPAMDAPRTDNQRSLNYVQFLEQHAVAPELKLVLDQHLPARKNFPAFTTQKCIAFDWLANHVVKDCGDGFYQPNTQTDRVVGANLINECAQQNDCNIVKAPIKKFYHRIIDGINELYLIAQKIKQSNKPFSLEQIQQLYEVCRDTNYNDITEDNIWNTQNGVVYIIDTEPRSFQSDRELDASYFINNLLTLSITPQAKDWLNKQLTDN